MEGVEELSASIFRMVSSAWPTSFFQGSLNVPIEHHPSIGDIISNRYLKVMSNIPKMGHLPTPVFRLDWMAKIHSSSEDFKSREVIAGKKQTRFGKW